MVQKPIAIPVIAVTDMFLNLLQRHEGYFLICQHILGFQDLDTC